MSQGRSHRLSVPERKFAAAYAGTADKDYAATIAGYSRPTADGLRALARPMVAAEVKRIQTERLHNELLPAAIDLLHSILTDAKENSRTRVAAAKIVLDRTLGAADAALDAKEPHEMTAAELADRLARLRRRQAELAGVVDDAETVDDTPQAGVFD